MRVKVAPKDRKVHAHYKPFSNKFAPISYEDARSFILGAVDFAAEHGFKPDSDYALAKKLIEPHRPFEAKYEYGVGGKPFFG